MTLLILASGCKKADSDPSATGTASATGAGIAAPKTQTPSPPKAFVQKGVPSGKVIVGYMQDLSDEHQCAALFDAPEKKDDFKKNGDELAKMMKGKIVPACPTSNVVGTCNAGFGLLVNYSSPKWTTHSAKKDCTSHPHATWVE